MELATGAGMQILKVLSIQWFPKQKRLEVVQVGRRGEKKMIEPWDALMCKVVQMTPAGDADSVVGRNPGKDALRNPRGQNPPRGLECAKRCLAKIKKK